MHPRPARPLITALARPLAMLLAAAAVAAVLSAVTVGIEASSARAASAASSASAATILKSFDPENIISDAVMYNPATMSQAAIQSFLNAEQPTCASGYTCLKNYRSNTLSMSKNLMCGAYKGATGETAAAIIYKVAQSCKLNPQVILVVLQKEQSLITGVDLGYYPNAYRSATGLGCPDTAVCDPAKYGFFNQVYGLGYWLIRYTTPKGTTGAGWTSYSWFPVGSPSGVLYNPSTSCGAKTLTIANEATASLYYYTPYTPNAASLAAGWGAATKCGAYGNRNFYLYFTSWFGSTHYTVTGAIKTAWTANGGAKGVLGNASGNAVAVTAGGVTGTTQKFQHGMIYSSAAGTVAVTGAVLTRYKADGGPAGVLGWAKTKVSTRATKSNGTGTVQGFTGGWVYSSTDGAFAVDGAVLSNDLGNDAQDGTLGWPTAEIVADSTDGGGFSQTFTGGAIYAHTNVTTRMLSGVVLTEYVRRGGPSSTLGWPSGSLITTTANGGGSSQTFTGGAIYSSSHGTIGVLGVFESNYVFHGGPAGSFGWPTAIAATDQAHGGGATQTFTGGTIFWSTVGSTHGFSAGPTLTAYVSRGGGDSTLGWPTTGALHVAAKVGGSVATFQSGSIYTSKAGAFSVRGTILDAYVAKSGPKGKLGWPKANSHKLADGSWTQAFTGGRITCSAAGGTTVTFTK